MDSKQIQKRLSTLFLAMIASGMFLLASCGGGNSSPDDSSSDTGALSFSVVYHSAVDRRQPQAAVIDCAGEGVSTVEAAIYDPDDALLKRGGPWDCDAGQGTISSVPAGSDRTVVILGKDGDGDVVFRGEKSDIQVDADSENDAGTIDCYAFVTSLQAPTDGSTVNAVAMVLAWNAVAGATEYHILVSESSNLSDPIIDEISTSSSYATTGLSNAKTYFWQVGASDSYKNKGIGSQVWSFTVNAEHVNAAPVAQITRPVENTTFTAADTITFACIASDIEDGDLNGASLVWRSDVDGQIGIGVTFSLSTLVSGTHQITLTAIDSERATGTDSVVISIPAGRLPDTGQTTAYTETFGEDSDYNGINPPAYTKLDASGNALDASAVNWVMVRDDVNGLIWEVKTDDDTIHDKDKQYNWQNAQNGFIVQLNSENFGGSSDWRLPTVKELYTILHNINVDPVQLTPKIATDYFPYTIADDYWSSTTFAANKGHAWHVYFYNGRVLINDKFETFYVRAVRGGKTTNNIVDNNDDTVTDMVTGLMWQKFEVMAQGGAEVRNMTWEDALDYCEKLDLAGYDDWRLPNAKELQSIADYERSEQPYIDEIFRNAVSAEYWSSTTYAGNAVNAWYVSFKKGSVVYNDKSNTYYVRAVRGGK